MSPYEEKYVDVKFISEISGSVSITVEEGSFLHLPSYFAFNFSR